MTHKFKVGDHLISIDKIFKCEILELTDTGYVVLLHSDYSSPFNSEAGATFRVNVKVDIYFESFYNLDKDATFKIEFEKVLND